MWELDEFHIIHPRLWLPKTYQVITPPWVKIHLCMAIGCFLLLESQDEPPAILIYHASLLLRTKFYKWWIIKKYLFKEQICLILSCAAYLLLQPKFTHALFCCMIKEDDLKTLLCVPFLPGLLSALRQKLERKRGDRAGGCNMSSQWQFSVALSSPDSALLQFGILPFLCPQLPLLLGSSIDSTVGAMCLSRLAVFRGVSHLHRMFDGCLCFQCTTLHWKHFF